MHNFYSVKFDWPIKESEKLRVLFPISLGQAYHYDDKFAAVIDFIQKNCQKAKFIPVLQTHAKQMWITNISNASALKGARRDRNKWLKETKEIRKKLTIEVEPRLPETSYEKLILEEDDRCWEYWLKISKDEIDSVSRLINVHSPFTKLLNAAAEAYTDNIINKIKLNHRNFILSNGDKEVFLHKARQAIIDELGVMLKWQQVFFNDYDFIAYPISQSNIKNTGAEKKGISALVVDCFNALFDKKTDIKLPIIDIKIQSLFNNEINSQSLRNERRNTIPKSLESNHLSNFKTNIGLQRSKSFIHYKVSNNSNSFAPSTATTYHDAAASSYSDSSSTCISTNSSTSISPVNSLPNSPDIKAFVTNSVYDSDSSQKSNSDSFNEPINSNNSDDTDDNADVAGMLDLELEGSMPEKKENFLIRIKDDLTSSEPDVASVLWENHVRLTYSQGISFNDILELIRDVLINEDLNHSQVQHLVKFTLSSEMIYKENLSIRKLLQKDKLKGKLLERVGSFLTAYDNKKKAIQEHQSKFYLIGKEAANSANSNLLPPNTVTYPDQAPSFFQHKNKIDESAAKQPEPISAMANVLF